MSVKNTHIYFFYFWFKNKRVWAEKIRKKRKNSKNIKVAGNYPNIKYTLVFQIFYMKNQNNQLLLLRLLRNRSIVRSSCYRKMLVQNLLIYIYLHCVRRLSSSATTLDTLMGMSQPTFRLFLRAWVNPAAALHRAKEQLSYSCKDRPRVIC